MSASLTTEERLYRLSTDLRDCEDELRATKRALADALEVGRIAQANLVALSTEIATAELARGVAA